MSAIPTEKRNKQYRMASLEDKRNSPFNSFLIDDPTPINHRITITNDESSIICIACQKDLHSCASKILSCLHSICVQCFDTIRDATGFEFGF